MDCRPIQGVQFATEPRERRLTMSESDSSNSSDFSRRRWLAGATSAVGGAVAVAAALPFAVALQPSRKTRAAGAPVRAEVNDIAAGDVKIVVWRRKPIFLLRRAPAMIESDRAAVAELSDPESDQSAQPDYCKNPGRSIKPDLLVAVGLCTHLGCSPRQTGPEGFFCACHGSRFDNAGRVYRGSPAPTNLIIPPHHYAVSGEVVVGEDPQPA